MAIPPGNHTDWVWPMSLIPRSWNARVSEVEPRALLKSKGYVGNLDIPHPTHWNLSKGPWWWSYYFALTTKGAWHFRFGCRYDFVDFYYVYPAFTIKRIKFQP
jgi:hypothetical protein